METEIVRHIAYFTDQANANIRADNPGRTDAELREAGLFFDDADMRRWNGIGSADFYIGTEDASIFAVHYGRTETHSEFVVTAERGEREDSTTNDEERWAVDIYTVKLTDTGESIHAVVRSDDSDSTVTFYATYDDAFAAFDEECGKDTFGGRA